MIISFKSNFSWSSDQNAHGDRNDRSNGFFLEGLETACNSPSGVLLSGCCPRLPLSHRENQSCSGSDLSQEGLCCPCHQLPCLPPFQIHQHLLPVLWANVRRGSSSLGHQEAQWMGVRGPTHGQGPCECPLSSMGRSLCGFMELLAGKLFSLPA